MNPHDWSPSELFNIGACLFVPLSCLSLSTWQACRSTTKGWFWRLYAVLMWAGLVVMLYSDKFADNTTRDMPAEFAIGVWLLLTGMIATATHGLFILIPYLRQHRQMPSS